MPGLYAFVSPIVALAAGAWLFGKQVGPPEVCGVVLLLTAAVTALWRRPEPAAIDAGQREMRVIDCPNLPHRIGGNLALDFANTYSWRGAPRELDHLVDGVAIPAWAKDRRALSNPVHDLRGKAGRCLWNRSIICVALSPTSRLRRLSARRSGWTSCAMTASWGLSRGPRSTSCAAMSSAV